MDGLTDSERRGARVLAILLVLGTLWDVWRSHHVVMAPEPAPEPAPVTAAGGAAPGAVGSAPPAVPRTLDLNHASAQELDALPGIGPVLARRIVERRERQGAFRHVDELLSVPGIGPRLLERLRPWLREPPG